MPGYTMVDVPLDPRSNILKLATLICKHSVQLAQLQSQLSMSNTPTQPDLSRPATSEIPKADRQESAVYEIFANPASYEDVFSAATELQPMEFLDLRSCKAAMKQWLDLKR